MLGMGRLYSTTFQAQAIAEARDLWEIVAGSAQIILIEGIALGQTTETGDAAEELLRVEIHRGYTTSGSGGATATAIKVNPGDAASTATVEERNTTLATTAGEVVHADTFNVRTGYQYMPPPEHRIILQASQRAVVRLPAAPVDSITFTGTLYWREIG